MQCSNLDKVKIFGARRWRPTRIEVRDRTSCSFWQGTAPAIAGWRCAQYDGIVALAACEHFGRGPGVSSMMVVLLIAGIGFLLAGLLAIGFGIPVKEFSFGNTLILTGAVVACTGRDDARSLEAVRELKNLARQLGLVRRDTHAGKRGTRQRRRAAQSGAGRRRFPVRPRPAGRKRRRCGSVGQPRCRRRHGTRRPRRAIACAAMPPAPEPVEAAPAVKPRRNLLFSSSSRKERERAQARTTDPSAADLRSRAARRAAAFRIERGAAGDVRRRLAETGTREGRRCATAAAQRPGAIDVYRSERWRAGADRSRRPREMRISRR